MADEHDGRGIQEIVVRSGYLSCACPKGPLGYILEVFLRQGIDNPLVLSYIVMDDTMNRLSHERKPNTARETDVTAFWTERYRAGQAGLVRQGWKGKDMNWSEVCGDKLLQDLPYKIELNEWGNIVMSPASNRHGNIQTKVAFLLMSWMEHGTVLTECSVDTSKGVKVADVVWASAEFLERNKGQTPYIEAPEVCVEIKSPSNSDEEMMEKRDLYFAKGAKEFWLCDEDGNVAFFNCRGRMDTSQLFPKMVREIEVDA